MKIEHCKVYELGSSILASGLPMTADTAYTDDWVSKAEALDTIASLGIGAYQYEPHLKRAIKLAQNADGSGHKNFMLGIRVATNVTATNAWWMQFERYHFADIVSSQSKMHCLRKLVDNEASSFHHKVASDEIARLKELMSSGADDETLTYNCPIGLELTARITTNYLQLRTIYKQRINHKLAEWREFCAWIETLPLADKLITYDK